MKKELVLVKLGGGLITDKRVRYGLKERRLARLAREMGEAWQELKDRGELIVGNGAGSFAHFSARKYGTKNGFGDETGAIGAGWVHWDAVKLNQIVVEALLKEEVPALSLSPAAMMVQNTSEVWVGGESLKIGIEKGLVPVVYGDVILDKERGSTIFSTEKVFEVIFEQMDWWKDKFEKIRVVQAGLEKGVLGDGEVIPVISRDNWEEVKDYLGGSGGVDVTGGMWHKVKTSLKLADSGIETWIVSGLEGGRVKKAILGEEVGGTRIVTSGKQ